MSVPSNINAAIANERHEILHNNSDEGSMKNANERRRLLHKNSNEGSPVITSKRHGTLQNESDRGSTPITQDFEEVEEMEMRDDSVTNDRSSDDFLENNSSQESHRSRKLVVSAPRSMRGRENEVKKFYCEKGARVKVRR